MSECRRPPCKRRAPSGWGGWCTEHAYSEGYYEREVPAERGREKVLELLKEGYKLSQVAKAAEISYITAKRLRDGETKLMRQRTLRKLEGVRSFKRRPVWPIRRRIQALRAIGFTIKELEEGLGISHTLITQICYSETKESIESDLYDRICEYYDENQLAEARPVKSVVAKEAWWAPLAWDNIDDLEEGRNRKKKCHKSIIV